eukprot:5567677-Pleurochrysis_carterae.AAC.1
MARGSMGTAVRRGVMAATMRTSEWGGGEGPNSRRVSRRQRLRSQAIRVGSGWDGGGGLVGVGLELGAIPETPDDGGGRVK